MVEHRVGLERYASGTVEKVQSLLKDVQVDIERQVIKQYPWASRNPDRLRKLLGVVKEAQKEAHIVIRRDFKGDLEAIGKYEAEWAAKYYGSHSAELGVSASFNRPSAALLKSIVTSKPMQGEVLGGWAKKMERNQLERIERHIRMGVAQGEGVTEMVQRLQGTGALKFRDGQWVKDQRSAEALVRTATNHISNQAHREFGVVNGNLSGRVLHSSVLDRNTTPTCMARAGVIYDADKFQWPPLHWNCRSSGVYISKFDTGVKSELRYDKWLRDQPASVQDDVLGKAKGKLFRDGKLKIDRFVSRKGDALTLDQLRQRESAAWERAFK